MATSVPAMYLKIEVRLEVLCINADMFMKRSVVRRLADLSGLNEVVHRN